MSKPNQDLTTTFVKSFFDNFDKLYNDETKAKVEKCVKQFSETAEKFGEIMKHQEKEATSTASMIFKDMLDAATTPVEFTSVESSSSSEISVDKAISQTVDQQEEDPCITIQIVAAKDKRKRIRIEFVDE